MSTDRTLPNLKDSTGTPRVSLDHALEAATHYGKWRVRKPRYPDEEGAVAIVLLMDCGDPSHEACGGRMAFFRASNKQCEVRTLPRLPP